MRPAVQPHPLTPAERAGMRLCRSMIACMAVIQRRRAAALPGAVELRRHGGRAAETLEILHPAAGVPARDAVVFIHGGGWICGRKDLYSADLAFLVERGHRVYNLDYPLAPEHPYPLALISLLRALAWIRRSQPGAAAVHLMGDSAGGNLAMMLGLLERHPALRGQLDPSLGGLALPATRSVVSLYGVLDRLSWLRMGFPGARLMLQSYGGRGAFEPEVGPELALCPLDLEFDGHPPCLLAVGSRDRLAESSRLAFARLDAQGGDVLLRSYEGESHGFFNMRWRENALKLREDITLFLDAQTEPHAALVARA